MHRFFFATKDAFISSGSNQITGEDWLDKNTGQDEVLELKKVFWNRDFHYPTRLLIKFDADEIENFISSSNVYTKDPSYKTNLRLWETKGTSGLSETYKIAAYQLVSRGMRVLVKSRIIQKLQTGLVGKIDNIQQVVPKWRGQLLVEVI